MQPQYDILREIGGQNYREKNWYTRYQSYVKTIAGYIIYLKNFISNSPNTFDFCNNPDPYRKIIIEIWDR